MGHAAAVGTREEAPLSSYREAEQRLWSRYGLAPTEHRLSLPGTGTAVRVLEVGTGAPAVFVGGTGGTGPYWAPLLAHLTGVRALLVDRPGYGLSDPVAHPRGAYRTFAADFLRDVLDALELDRAPIVGASIGNVWALALAHRHPARAQRVVLLGGGPISEDIRPPKIIRLIASPIGALMVRMPEKPKMARNILRSNGHGQSLENGTIAEEYLAWRQALTTSTRSMRAERSMIQSVLDGSDWAQGLTFADPELRTLVQPLLMVYGTQDPVGSPEIWRRLVGLAPQGTIQIVDGAGHVPWLDDGAGIAGTVGRFLQGGSDAG